MEASYLRRHHLSIEIPYRRNLLDRFLDGFASILASRLPKNPRRNLARMQLERLGIPTSPDGELRLYRSALREAFRILSGGWNRLDLSALEPSRTPPWVLREPTLFLSMHHGQWEWLAGILTRLRPDTLCVARSPGHPAGRTLLHWTRSRIGLRMSHDLDSVRSGRRQLASGGMVAFLADQRPPGASRPGTWLGLPTMVSKLPEWWARDLEPRLWTGVLRPGLDSYALELDDWDPSSLPQWDRLLDQQFLPLVRSSPWEHFGLWHHRLEPRRSRRPSKRVH